MVQIRAVRESDDFEKIWRLINDTMQRSTTDQVSYGQTCESLKQGYGGLESSNKGFIAEEDENVVAFMGVYHPESGTSNVIECGYLEDYMDSLESLLDRCMAVVQKSNGDKLYKFTFTKFGQVRNKEVTLWEKLGFTSDEYSLVTTKLDLSQWEVPDALDTTGIEPAMAMNYEEIRNILIEDDEDEMAALFLKQYAPIKGLDEVILTIRDEISNDIAGIAYYRVRAFNEDGENQSLYAGAFGIHIRPKYNISSDEISRFLQGVLSSMKQLNIDHVITRITLKNFAVFSAMIREGFRNDELENSNVLRLYRNIPKG